VLRVSGEVLRTVFSELFAQRVALERHCPQTQHGASWNGLYGSADCGRGSRRHRELLSAIRAAAVPAIAFLSGGQPAELASARLNAMNVRFKSRLPWALAFSFARAIQQPALEIWNGRQTTSRQPSKLYIIAPAAIRPARRGEYSQEMETK